MIGPDRPELRGKQDPAENPDPDFRRGFEAGIIASEPSAFTVFRLLVARQSQRSALDPEERIRRGYPKPSEFTLEGDRQAEVYVGGYISGLRVFLSEHRFDINSPSPLGLISPVILRGFDTLNGYVDGLGRKHPKLYNKLNQREKPSQAEYEEEERRRGYTLGFAVGLMRDFGIRANLADVPEDAETFVDFDLGRNGEAGRSQQPSYRDFTELRSQRAYELGLTVWLKQQGIKEVKAPWISSALALEAFKAALGGATLTQYEPLPKPRLEQWWRLPSWELPGLMRNNNLFEKPEVNDDEIKKTPTNQEIERMRTVSAYRLGKRVREQRLAREQTTSEQTPPQQ